jgi:acyl dehydratase
MSKFNVIQIGDKAHLSRQITKGDMATFAELTGDRNPLHFDAAFAKKMNFEAPVVHGMLTCSFLSTLIGTVMPGAGSIITNVGLDFKKPVFIDDIVCVNIEVIKKIFLSKEVVFKITITNQRSETVVVGTTKAVCPE